MEDTRSFITSDFYMRPIYHQQMKSFYLFFMRNYESEWSFFFTESLTCYLLFECHCTKNNPILASELHRPHQENRIQRCASSLSVVYSDKNNIWVSSCQILATESENSRKQMSPQKGDKQIHFFVLQILRVTCHLMIITFVEEWKLWFLCGWFHIILCICFTVEITNSGIKFDLIHWHTERKSIFALVFYPVLQSQTDF